MARPKKLAFLTPFAVWIAETSHLSLPARTVHLELSWFRDRFGANSLPFSLQELARIARCSPAELRRVSGELATLYPQYFAQANPPPTQQLESFPQGGVEKLLADRGKHRPVQSGTLPGTNAGTGTYVPGLETDRVRSSPDGSPSSSRVTDDGETRHDGPGAAFTFRDALPMPPPGDHVANATWLVRVACLTHGGTLRGDRLRRAVFDVSQEPTLGFGAQRQNALPMAWSAVFWKSLPNVAMRTALDQPDTADPGHPEVEVTWTDLP